MRPLVRCIAGITKPRSEKGEYRSEPFCGALKASRDRRALKLWVTVGAQWSMEVHKQ